MDRKKGVKIQHSSESLFVLGKDRKRNEGTAQIQQPPKKAKIAPIHSAGSSSSSNITESWEDAINVECENISLISSVLQATGNL